MLQMAKLCPHKMNLGICEYQIGRKTRGFDQLYRLNTNLKLFLLRLFPCTFYNSEIKELKFAFFSMSYHLISRGKSIEFHCFDISYRMFLLCFRLVNKTYQHLEFALNILFILKKTLIDNN